MLFFDTSAAIGWLRGDPNLAKVAEDEQVMLSVVSVYELLWASRRKSEKAVDAANRFIAACTTIPVSDEIARRAAHIKGELAACGKDKPMADLLIAASAETEGGIFVTFDRDFEDISRFCDLHLHLLKGKV